MRRASFNDVEAWVMGLSANRADERDEWIKVGMSIHAFDSSECGLALWEHFSSRSAKYREGECEKKWKGFVADKTRAVSVATLSFMHMQDNGGVSGRGGLSGPGGRNGHGGHSKRDEAIAENAQSKIGNAQAEKSKFWKSLDEANAAFYRLPCVAQDDECAEFLRREYGLPRELLPHHWTVLEVNGRKGIVYLGLSLDQGVESAFKWKSLARTEKKPGVWKRDQMYLFGAGSTMDLNHMQGEALCIVCGEEKALAAYGAGYRAFCPLNGEHALTEEQCKFIAGQNLERVVLANDNDEAGRKANIGTAEALERAGVDPDVIHLIDWGNRPEGYDLNDIAKTSGLQAVRRALDEAKPWKVGAPALDLWDVDRLFAYQIDPLDNWMDDKALAAGEVTLIIGPPDIGKSRLVTQLIFDLLLGHSHWLETLPLRKHAMNIMLIQTENSAERMQIDFKAQMSKCAAEHRRIVRNHLRFHVPQSPEDRDLRLDDPQNLARLTKTVKRLKPDLVILDPYGDFFAGENENDAMPHRRTVRAIMAFVQAASPKTAAIIIHHAKSGQAAAASAEGWDKQAYGRGSKALMSISRSQINIAPGDEEGRKLTIVHGKNNNGKKFKTFGVYLDETAMRYRRDIDFNVEEWREKVSSRKSRDSAGRKPLVDPSMVLSRVPEDGEEAPMKLVVSGIMDAHGISKRAVYYLIDELVERGEIHRREEQKGNISRAFLSR